MATKTTIQPTKPKRAKTGGRQAGVPNKISRELKADLNQFLLNDYDKFIEEMAKLHGKAYVDAYTAFCKIIIGLNVNATLQTQRTIEDKLAELCGYPEEE